MVRTKLRNIFLKNRSEENKINYNKQKNLCLTILRKSKKEYYQHLSVENACCNKKLWKVVEPVKKIALVEETNILKIDKETAKILNNFFSTIIQNLKISQYEEQDPISASIGDIVMRSVVEYKAHPSIIAIKENFNSSIPFNFLFVDKEDF